MTDQEKQRIAVMRSTGESYKEIAKTLNLSLNTVQTFCRRNQLTGMRGGVSTPKDLSAAPATDGLPSAPKDGNSTAVETPERRENTGVSRKQPAFKVKLEFADADDESAVPDVLRMLMEGRW